MIDKNFKNYLLAFLNHGPHRFTIIFSTKDPTNLYKLEYLPKDRHEHVKIDQQRSSDGRANIRRKNGGELFLQPGNCGGLTHQQRRDKTYRMWQCRNDSFGRTNSRSEEGQSEMDVVVETING